jgi:hypothetical protein
MAVPRPAPAISWKFLIFFGDDFWCRTFLPFADHAAKNKSRGNSAKAWWVNLPYGLGWKSPKAEIKIA